jgi:hypothetical protein
MVRSILFASETFKNRGEIQDANRNKRSVPLLHQGGLHPNLIRRSDLIAADTPISASVGPSKPAPLRAHRHILHLPARRAEALVEKGLVSFSLSPFAAWLLVTENGYNQSQNQFG